MRRGLMQWSEDELPVAVLDERIARLQAAMRRDGLQALLLYTNLVRPSAVSYLTGFTPYWSDGILMVGRDGPPSFATALSKRVANWIRSVSPVGEIVNTPRPGADIGARIDADISVKRVGILELDTFPSGLYDDLAAAAPAVEWADATQLFAQSRRGADPAERRLLARADAIAAAALDQVDAVSAAPAGLAEAAPARAEDTGSVAGRVEQHARLNAAEEAYILVAPDLVADRRMIRGVPSGPVGDYFALCASIAYKGHWVRRGRTFARDAAAAGAFSRADAWFARVIRSIKADTPLARQMAAQVEELAGAELKSWTAESCVGSYPLQVIAASQSAGDVGPQEGDFLVLTVELCIDGAPWLGAAPLIVGGQL